jgi:proteic killer suppression protein
MAQWSEGHGDAARGFVRTVRLGADRARGQHSIRINEQYRVCFRWEGGYADDVEVTDYH